MQRIVVTCAALLLAAGAVAGCGPDPEVVAEQQREEQWQQIEQTRQDLSAKRAELEQASHQAAMEPEGEEGDETAGEESGEGAAAGGGAAAADLERLESEATEIADQYYQQLIEFINANPPVAGEPPPERVQQAIRAKSDEDIRIAQEYIEQGGDYRRAITIYQGALEADPDYARLQEMLAEAEEMRFMTEERFAQVEKGMTRDEVRAALGPVNLRNVRDYEEGKTKALAWFYPRDEAGSAAAVWFRENRRGEYEVYEVDFHFKDAGDDEEGAG